MVNEISQAPEHSAPVFRNEGRYTIIDGKNVESGTYYVDTRQVQQYVNLREWESHLKLSKDGAIKPSSDEINYDIPAYIEMKVKFTDFGKSMKTLEVKKHT